MNQIGLRTWSTPSKTKVRHFEESSLASCNSGFVITSLLLNPLCSPLTLSALENPRTLHHPTIHSISRCIQDDVGSEFAWNTTAPLASSTDATKGRLVRINCITWHGDMIYMSVLVEFYTVQCKVYTKQDMQNMRTTFVWKRPNKSKELPVGWTGLHPRDYRKGIVRISKT
jgi:hypothetical protein